MNKKTNVLCIFDSFKGSLSSEQLGLYSKEVLNSIGIDSDYLTIADGGEGTNAVFNNILHLNEKKVSVHDLNMKSIKGIYLHNDTTAYIESAQVIGLNMKHNDIKNCSSYGIGELINDAYEQGLREFVISLGGTGTSDLGIGALCAMGLQVEYKLNKRFNNPVLDVVSFEEEKLGKFKKCNFIILSDVTNPLLGVKGSNRVFAGQKGATNNDIIVLEDAFNNFNNLCDKVLNSYIGGGAAGGIAASFSYFLGAKIQSGIDTLLDLYKFDQIISKYDLIITGEGSFDNQSLDGKVINGICTRSAQTPILVLAGSVDPKIEITSNKKEISFLSIQTKPCALEQALTINTTKENLKTTLINVMQLYKFNR